MIIIKMITMITMITITITIIMITITMITKTRIAVTTTIVINNNRFSIIFSFSEVIFLHLFSKLDTFSCLLKCLCFYDEDYAF